MHCQRKTQCAACTTTFSSLCDLHYHLSRGFEHLGYIYSVHLLQNGLLLVYPARDVCLDKGTCTGKYELSKPTEQHLGNPKKDVAHSTDKHIVKDESAKQQELNPATANLQNQTCTEQNKEKHGPLKKPEYVLAPTKKLTIYATDIASKNICKENHYSAIPTLKSLALPKKGLEYQEKNGRTEVQKGENKSPNKTVESLSKPIDTVTKPTSRTFVPREVVVYSAGQISSFVHDFEISEGGISIFSAKEVGKEMPKNVDNSAKQKQIHVGIARSDDSTVNRKLSITENKTIDKVLDKTTKHNVKHFLVTDNNKHHKKENNAFHKDLYMNKHADIKQDCANKTEGVCDPVVNFGTEVINSYQKEADITRQCSYHIRCDKVLTGEDENILSDKLDSSEKLSFLNEHSYSKTLSTNDSQCDQEFNEWKVFYNENYFEDNDQLQIDENTSKGFKELEVEFPDNIIDTETYSKTDPLITAKFNESNVNENSVSNAEVPFIGGNKDRSLKASCKGPDRTNEVDLKIPKIGQQSLSVFTRYGFELIQREKFYIQCRFCSQTCSGNEIVRHIDINHVEHPENTNIFQSEFMLLKRFLRDNWSPDSKFFQMELTRGKRYRLYGFSIKPVPELKFICAACKKSFCRNDFIEHVSKCYKKCYKMNTTEEISHQLELLKKISPVFKIKKRKTKDAKLATLLSMKARTYLSKRDMLEEFKSLKPELFKMNNSQFLKEFEEYVEQKKEENKKKQQELISCTVCSKKIKASYMACHMKYAHTSQPYLCAVCGGVYSCERALNSHLHYVHGEKGHFPCSVCGKEFTKENALRQHSYYVHQLQRQFQCYVCGKSFKTRNCLNNHELIHRETRPFSCIVCKATFKRADHLRVHIDKIHDLKVIWVCSFPGCESKYKCKAQLVAHVQRHKGYIVHYCPQQYTILRKLNRHMEECHSIKEKLKIGRADIKEMEYGFDGITRLKTLLIHEDELQPEQKEHFKWTDKENSIFMDVMDKYIETKGTAPKSALNKVKKRLKGTKTLKEIKLKLETARCMSRQRGRHVSLSSKKEVKKQLQTQAPLNGLLKDGLSVGNGIDFQLSEDVGLESGNSYSIAVEQKDATEDTVCKNGTFDGETK